MNRRAILLTLALWLAAPTAHAWDSWCVVYTDPHAPVASLGSPVRSCTLREAAFGRYRGTTVERSCGGDGPAIRRESEHARLFERSAELARLPAAALETHTLRQFLGAGDDPALGDAPVLAPFEQTSDSRRRSFAVAELAALPDFSFALWDWARGNDTCPIDGGAPDPEGYCHGFAPSVCFSLTPGEMFGLTITPGHMGAVNSNHFPPQADRFYEHYHALALARARQCASQRMFLGSSAGRFHEYLAECELEALALEAVAQHFYQDTWSVGHMWERWGSPDLEDFEPYPMNAVLQEVACGWAFLADPTRCGQQLRASIAGLVAGLAHGSALSFGECDAMCCPFASTGQSHYRQGGSPEVQPGLGDHYIDNLVAGSTQERRMLECSAGSIAEVYDALGPEAALGERELGAITRDPTGADCRQQRATNASMADALLTELVSAGLDDPAIEAYLEAHPDITPEELRRIRGTGLGILSDVCFYSPVPPLVGYVCTRDVEPALRTDTRVELLRFQVAAVRAANARPNDTDIAESPPPFLGVERNSAYLPGTALHPSPALASYVDPALPWPSSPFAPVSDGPRAEALARTFHRGHAAEWCPRTTTETLEALRANVASASGSELGAACQACVEIVRRHVRLGCDPADAGCSGGYDTSAEPFCHTFMPATGSPAYVYQPGDSATAAAEAWCGEPCGGRLAVITDAGLRVLSGTPLELEPGPPLPLGALPRGGAFASGSRLYVGHSSGVIAGYDLSNGATELDLNGVADGTHLALGGDLRGVAVASRGGRDWLFVGDGSSDRLHVIPLPEPDAASQAIAPCATFDVGADPARREEPWDVVVARDASTAYVSLRGPLATPGNGVAIVALADVLADYETTGTCAPPASIQHVRHLVQLGFGPMALSPDGSRLAVGARRTAFCPDQIHELRTSCSGSICTPVYVPVDAQVGCDGVYVLETATRTWMSFDGAGGVSTRPVAYPYAVTWLDDRHLALGSFQFPLSGWPAGVFDPGWSALPGGGAVRLVDVEGATFDHNAGSRQRFSTYNVAMASVMAGENLYYSPLEEALYVGGNDGRLLRLPGPTAATYTPSEIDPFWEGTEADPESTLHDAVGGSWYGGCRYECSRPGGVCPRACSAAAGDPVTEIALGSPIRALVAP